MTILSVFIQRRSKPHGFLDSAALSSGRHDGAIMITKYLAELVLIVAVTIVCLLAISRNSALHDPKIISGAQTGGSKSKD